MTDMELLREYAGFSGTPVEMRAVLLSSADRIEKLEAALREIRNWDVAYYWNDAGPLASHMQSVASKALEGVQ